MVQNRDLLQAISAGLTGFSDLQHFISAIVQIPKHQSTKFCEQSINKMISLYNILRKTQELAFALEACESVVLKDIFAVTRNQEVAILLDKISLVLDDNISVQHTPAGLRNLRCHAVRAGANDLLDIARKTYREANEDCDELVDSYNHEFNLPVKLKFSPGIGYYMTVRKEEIKDESMWPSEFINVKRKRNEISFTSLKLMSQNERLSESLQEIYLMSEESISKLIMAVIDYLPLLYKISDAVAMLDLIASFAEKARQSDYVKPEFTDTLALQQARHPILESLKNVSVVENHCYMDAQKRLVIITGPNMVQFCNLVRKINLSKYDRFDCAPCSLW